MEPYAAVEKQFAGGRVEQVASDFGLGQDNQVCAGEMNITPHHAA